MHFYEQRYVPGGIAITGFNCVTYHKGSLCIMYTVH